VSAATGNILGQDNRHPVSQRKLAQLFSVLRPLIINHSPLIALQRCANVKQSSLIAKLA
jgi:hypothetical protein